jgi:hypothetical protein
VSTRCSVEPVKPVGEEGSFYHGGQVATLFTCAPQFPSLIVAEFS